ncbi:MAG: peptidoglycan DD-metalloendopeptidase family protein [Candidatus Rokubacteria bacterium]|nr:peptidoglycan DD-metalloendopeptidase family protein [Candidatus Rokubacteria bacterium]
MRRTIALALLGVLALAPVAGAQQKKGADADALKAEQRRLQETQRQLSEERAKAAEAKKRETSLLAELEGIDKSLEAKKSEVTRLDARIDRAEADLKSLRGDIGRLAGRRSEQEEQLMRRLRALYKVQAEGGAVPVLLGGEDPVRRAAAIRSLTSLAGADARLIDQFRLTTDRLEDRKRKEETRQAELATLRVDARREQVEVDREAGKRRVLLAKVRDERQYHERMVGELSEAARRLEAFVRELQERQRRLARVPPPKPGAPVPEPAPGAGFGSLRGRLIWPTDGKIVAGFGAQVHPRFGTKTFKNGVDIEAAQGTEVGAVYAGHVIYTGWFKGYGNLIILDHGNDYVTLYAHVKEILVKEGDDVRQGHKIATVGDTGALAGPRLYFEVRYQGKPQDPEQWLRGQRS